MLGRLIRRDSARQSQQPPMQYQWRPSTAVDITEGMREMIIDNETTPRATSPTTYPFKNKSISKGSLNRSGRPKMKHKAATAPVGSSLQLFTVVPEPPRRAISARSIRSPLFQDGRSVRGTQTRSSFLRPDSHSTAESRSLISRRKSNRRSGGRLGLKPKGNVWRILQPAKNTVKSEQLSQATGSSFSEKARVQTALRHKEVTFLQTDMVDFQDKNLVETPSSMLSTPQELYGSAERDERPHRLEPRLVLQSTALKKERRLSLPLTPSTQRASGYSRRGSEVPADETIWRRTTYIPGPIRFVEAVPTPRRGSLATMEPFIGEIEWEGNGRRLSDMAVLDGIAAYFWGLDTAEEAREDGLDHFWVLNRTGSDGLAPLAPRGPRMLTLPSSAAGGMFQPQSQNGQESGGQILLSQHPRQRFRVRRLLNAASTIL
ncbi:hypothetical protein EJ04DRAFT_573205 [Polyplosphaeria fusca]|uniref:Uncharacterized protein n=1 Tax=Polyplosphaeria fusca TaxID=682080 RepID=A0A9P4V456_9PLEO|nr:hypothetical protein EJ04DRAFT_573205 [Polyplosphaeria fusca]